MPSNKELKATIVETAEALGVDAPNTDGMNNAKLAETLSELKKSAPVDVQEPQDDGDSQVQEPQDDGDSQVQEPQDDGDSQVQEPAAAPYSVAKGKAITTKRGILADGAAITPEDLPGGIEALEHFVKTGHVVKK